MSFLAGDYKKAISYFERVLKVDPRNENVKKKLDESRELLKKKIEELFKAGVREFRILYFDRAILQWNKVITLAEGFDREMLANARARIADAEKRKAELKR